MPLRIGFDMDGVLADFSSAFKAYGTKLFGPVEPPPSPFTGVRRLPGDQPETEEARQAVAELEARNRVASAQALRRREDKIWQAIESTPNFWMTLKPIDDGAVRRIHRLTLEHHWEVFFITQRPFTEGDTVQRQTQHWLVEQGFDLPSVLVISGSRGAAAKAIRLDYHVDDSPQNCHDVVGESTAKPILIVSRSHDQTIANAKRLGIGTATRIGDAIDILEQATLAQTNPSLLQRIASMVGWK
jgi:hypothetical protein